MWLRQLTHHPPGNAVYVSKSALFSIESKAIQGYDLIVLIMFSGSRRYPGGAVAGIAVTMKAF